MQIAPVMNPPFDGANTEIRVTGKDRAVIQRTSGYNSPGQDVRVVRNGRGKPTELWAGGSKLLPREDMVAEVTGRYRPARRKAAA